MKQTDLKGTLLAFDQSSYDADLSRLESATESVNHFLAEYEKLGLGPADDETYRDALRNGINTIRSNYSAHVENEIQRQGLKLRSQIEYIRGNTESDLQDIRKAIQKINWERAERYQQRHTVKVELISIVDGKALITDAAKLEMRKEYSVYIEDVKAFELLSNVIKASNEAMEYLKAMGDFSHYGDVMFSDLRNKGFLEEKDDHTLEIVASSFDWFQKMCFNTRKTRVEEAHK